MQIHTANNKVSTTSRFECRDVTHEWFSTDNLMDYKQNLSDNLVPEHYQNASIQYVFNSQGYRTPELDTFKQKQFVLALGCSYTQGVGLYQHEIWCEQLAKLLNTQCMNLGVEGTGLDFNLYQTVNYLNGDYALPSLVVVQNSHGSRRLDITHGNYSVGDNHETEIGTVLTDDYDIHVSSRITPEGMKNCTTEFQNGKWIDAITHIWNGVGVPVIHWTYDIDCETEYSADRVFHFPREHFLNTDWHHDVARDCVHNGPVDNLRVAENIQYIWKHMQQNDLMRFTTQHALESQLSDEQLAQRKITEQRNRTNIIYN